MKLWPRTKPEDAQMPTMHPEGVFDAAIVNATPGISKASGTPYITICLQTSFGKVFAQLSGKARYTWELPLTKLLAIRGLTWDWNETSVQKLADTITRAAGIKVNVHVTASSNIDGQTYIWASILWNAPCPNP